MYYNRDELLLLSRTGRVPPAVRAGPRSRDPLIGPGGALRGEPRLLQAFGAAVSRMLQRGRCIVAGPQRESAPAVGYADPEGYLELEFAVGFAAEDEPWLESTQ